MNEKLHPFHIMILIYMNQTGVVIMSLPHLLAENFGYNGWLGVILISLVVNLNIFIISIVYRLGKGKSIFQIMESSLPRVITFPIYMILIGVWSMTGCMVIKNYVYIYQIMSYNTTHAMLLKLLIDIIAYLLIIKGIYTISKAATSFFWITSWMLLLQLFFIKDFEWARLTPFLFKGDTHFLTGGFIVFTAFLGYELCFMLFPYADNPKKFIKSVYKGNLITTLTYLIFCLICFGFYSFEQIRNMMYPLLDLLSYIRLPFIERIENLLFGFFLFTTIVSVVLYSWSAQETFARIVPKANKKVLAFIILTFGYIVAWFPDTLSEVGQWLQYLGYAELGVAFGLPLLLILILVIHKGAKPS
ncbi:spore germination protein (amino acid permease) [Paenibacillus endophyticus]|uniref:Spore germination protein (Amino acid permease) n=1 Tax=Paenibacillus endophyticus TaxID=1294268 RepID=A0A7W5C4T3_9BACL|nr:GerAB/ArcD/ProY family transporter [Paenibacillus endophyticus]MBB3150704.1 spore germination protein (amino acid permease) [Paenibacillus endophyticus]